MTFLSKPKEKPNKKDIALVSAVSIIPVVGIVFVLIWAFSSTNPSRKFISGIFLLLSPLIVAIQIIMLFVVLILFVMWAETLPGYW